MIKIDPNTRIIDLTVGELMELIESAQADQGSTASTDRARKTVCLWYRRDCPSVQLQYDNGKQNQGKRTD